ncbi:MAG: His/Gly/Thr/Pro-type tRNA ligase C-terminal domain-containing protein, partial [[Clostridium] innocuum]
TTVLQVVTQLRAAGYRTDTDYLNRSMKAQFKTVDRMHAKVAIMIGEQDLESGSAAVKNIETKEKTEVAFDSIVEAIDAMFGEAEEEHTCTCGEEHCTCQKEQ